MTLGQVALLLIAGLAAGALNAVAGGGTLVTFPALLSVGLPPVSANVTNTVAVWPGYLSGAATYRGQLRAGRWPLALLAALAAAGAIFGTALLLTVPAKVFTALVPYLVLLATALIAAQPVLSRRLADRAGRDGPGSRPTLLVATFAGAVYGAYFGGGLGIVLLAALALGTGAELTVLNGPKTVLTLVINTVALVGFALFGPVSWVAALVVTPASLLGGFLGARLAQRLRPAVLRWCVVAFGAAVGGWLLWRS